MSVTRDGRFHPKYQKFKEKVQFCPILRSLKSTTLTQRSSQLIIITHAYLFCFNTILFYLKLAGILLIICLIFKFIANDAVARAESGRYHQGSPGRTDSQTRKTGQTDRTRHPRTYPDSQAHLYGTTHAGRSVRSC